jgi:hypothetical protein
MSTDASSAPHDEGRLRQTARIAAALADRLTNGVAVLAGLLGRLWRIVKHVWALRGVLLENRALLVRTGALVRFVNPGFLLLVVAATVATGLLGAGALLAVVAAWIL